MTMRPQTHGEGTFSLAGSPLAEGILDLRRVGGLAMPAVRDTFRYTVRVDGKTVYVGITNDLKRRTAEHHRRWPSAEIVKVGSATTMTNARSWENRRVRELGPTAARSTRNSIGPVQSGTKAKRAPRKR